MPPPPPPPGRRGVKVGRREKVKRTERVGEKGEGEAVDVAPPLSSSGDPVGLAEGKEEGVDWSWALGVAVDPPWVEPVALGEREGGLLGRELGVPPPPPPNPATRGSKEGVRSVEGV